MTTQDQVVFLTVVIEDDDAVRESLSELLHAKGWRVQTFASSEEFLQSMPLPRPACLLLDAHLPGLSGPDLIALLKQQGHDVPVVLFSAFADRRMTVSALRNGAVTVLAKPVSEKELFEALSEARDIERERLSDHRELAELTDLFAQLTTSEDEVMRRICSGEQNKAIAYDLDLSLRTVELRRHNIFEKLKVEGVADLVKRSLRFTELRARYPKCPYATEDQGSRQVAGKPAASEMAYFDVKTH